MLQNSKSDNKTNLKWLQNTNLQKCDGLHITFRPKEEDFETLCCSRNRAGNDES